MVKNKNKGFVLLYAVLVASIVAIGGTLLADIIAKQIILSSVGRESQFAYYAATAGDECANYWDGKLAFGYVEPNEDGDLEYVPNPSPPAMDCNGNNIVIDSDIQGGVAGRGVYEFTLTDLQQGACAVVKVTQQAVSDGPTLIIESRGYNTSQGDCGTGGSNRLLERVITRSA